MAKLFEVNDIEEEVVLKKASAKSYSRGSLLLLFLLFIVITVCSIVVIVKEKREEIYKNRESMKLANLVVMDNRNILTKKVKYVTSKKTDPDDTSDIFFEVINGNDKYQEGDLIKFAHRFLNETELEGEKYCVIDTDQIQFHLEKKHVKEDLLKR